MTPPTWALTIAYWLHMLATVIWVGGLASLSIVIIPSARQSLAPEDFTHFLERVQKRIDPLAWFSLALLAFTGLIQMTGSPNYEGFLAIENRWAQAILLKHLVFLGMIGISAYLTWGVLPSLRRSALLRSSSQIPTQVEQLRNRETSLIRINFLLSLLVLALTALARTA